MPLSPARRHRGRALALVLALGAAAACDQRTGPPPGAVSVPAPTHDALPPLVRGTYDGTWRDFTPPGGGVTVSMPGTPGANAWTFELTETKIPEVSYMLATSDGARMLSLSVAEVGDALAGQPLEERLRSAAEHFTVFAPAERTKYRSEATLVGELPAWDATSESKEGWTCTVRAFAAGARLYGLIAVTSPTGGSPDVARFLASARVAP